MDDQKSTSSPSTDETTTTNDPAAPSKRPKRRNSRRKEEKSLIERVNALSLEAFCAQYFPPHRTTTTTTITTTTATTAQTIIQPSNSLPRLSSSSLTTWAEMQPSSREACIDLLEATSLGHYRGSETGWSRSKKLREMRHPALKYLLLLVPPPPPTPSERDAAARVVEGFLSFMITEEDGREVIYCYELHLQPRLRGKGIGKRMMELMEMIGARVGVEKAMLTVFRSNERAIRAYRKWGYEIDEFSPQPRTLRDGTVKEASYVILSKKRGDFAHEEIGQ